MSGIDHLDEIIEYGNERLDFLEFHFGIDKIPSKSTLSRVLNAVDGEAVAGSVVEIMRDNLPVDGEIIAIDGKAIRQRYQDERAEKVHIISAFLTKTGVLLGQKCISEKENEIPVVREPLDLFNISGKIITADAMHCQRETVEKIVKSSGEYVLSLKKNQPSFYADVEEHFEENDESTFESAETKEINKGRYEHRQCFKSIDSALLNRYSEWLNLQAFYKLERFTLEKGKPQFEVSYFISSLDVSPEKMLEIIRDHWTIEAMHNILDVSFNEDDGRVLSKNGQISLNVFRKLAIAAHKNYLNDTIKTKTKPSIKSHMFKTLLSDKILPNILAFP